MISARGLISFERVQQFLKRPSGDLASLIRMRFEREAARVRVDWSDKRNDLAAGVVFAVNPAHRAKLFGQIAANASDFVKGIAQIFEPSWRVNRQNDFFFLGMNGNFF